MIDQQQLLNEVTRLPTSSGAAMRLLEVMKQPETSAADLGQVIESDPALSTQVIRMANAPYYGQSRRVASAHHAVTVLGFALVRSLAANAAFGFTAGRTRGVPEGFWEHSIATAAVSSLLAPRVGYPAPEAFSTGLLLDLGAALLFRHLGREYESVQSSARDGEATLVLSEHRAWGLTHADVGGQALRKMRFPDDVADAVSFHHHLPDPSNSELVRVVFVADLIAHEIDGTPPESAHTVEQDSRRRGGRRSTSTPSSATRPRKSRSSSGSSARPPERSRRAADQNAATTGAASGVPARLPWCGAAPNANTPPSAATSQ